MLLNTFTWSLITISFNFRSWISPIFDKYNLNLTCNFSLGLIICIRRKPLNNHISLSFCLRPSTALRKASPEASHIYLFLLLPFMYWSSKMAVPRITLVSIWCKGLSGNFEKVIQIIWISLILFVLKLHFFFKIYNWLMRKYPIQFESYFCWLS